MVFRQQGKIQSACSDVAVAVSWINKLSIVTTVVVYYAYFVLNPLVQATYIMNGFSGEQNRPYQRDITVPHFLHQE